MNRLSIRSFAGKVKRIMWIVISVLLTGMYILAGLLVLWSHPGKPKPFVDIDGHPIPGSLSEKIYVNINGMPQGMFIKSKDLTNPVLLYLHGGLPDYFLTEQYPTGLEDHFTVAWWEQRGAGMSFRVDISPEMMTTEQFIADTLEVTNYLRHRFGKEKIYLMGHSGGTFFGIQAAARAPEWYYAYVGVAQMSNQLKSEKLAYDYMLQRFRKNGNTKMVQKLEAAPVTLAGGTPAGYLALRDLGMHSLGVGTMHDMKSVITGIVIPSLQSRDYTLMEKFNTWRAKASTGVSSLWDDVTTTDLSQQVTEFDIPVYFLHGIYDYTVNYMLAKSYFEQLHAPIKGFYTFEQSAHSPIFEEPEKTLKIMLQDVLTGSDSLADR